MWTLPGGGGGIRVSGGRCWITGGLGVSGGRWWTGGGGMTDLGGSTPFSGGSLGGCGPGPFSGGGAGARWCPTGGGCGAACLSGGGGVCFTAAGLGGLVGFIQIAKYALGDMADAQTLYEMARNQDRLNELLNTVHERWSEEVYSRLYFEVNDLFDKFEWGYTAQLRGVANALTPFIHEPLRRRTKARPNGRTFRITELSRRPTTLILSCPLQDLDAAKRIGSVATSLLLSHIYERRPPPEGQPDRRVPLLLLLDETRLLSANLAEFLAVGRGFKAGVVTCYQELDQIKDEATRREMLTNSNTLIALRGVGPGSRKAISERLAQATVQVTGVGGTMGEDSRQQANVVVNRQDVPFLGEHEIRALPGPKHVAFVHIQDGTVHNAKPFLVDLTANGDNVPAAKTRG